MLSTASLGRLELVAARARSSDTYVSSQMAETTGLELAMAALVKHSRGYPDLVPHEVDTRIEVVEFLSIHGHL